MHVDDEQKGGVLPILAMKVGAKIAKGAAKKGVSTAKKGATGAVGQAKKGATGAVGQAKKGATGKGKALGKGGLKGQKQPMEQGVGEGQLAAQKAQMARQSAQADIASREQQVRDYKMESDTAKNDAFIANQDSKTKIIRLNVFRKIIDTITLPFRKLFTVIFHSSFPIAHYITLLLVFMFIAGAFHYYGKPVSFCKMTWFDKGISMVFGGYKTRVFAQNLLGVSYVTEPRPIIGGRCDNVYYYEKSMGDGGLCTSTIQPTDITWNINTEKNSDLNNIPAAITNNLSNEGKQFVVKIPWTVDKSGMQYTPDCAGATYLDGTPADLLVDKGDFCQRNVKTNGSYTETVRPNSELSTFEGLDKFATENNPMC